MKDGETQKAVAGSVHPLPERLWVGPELSECELGEKGVVHTLTVRASAQPSSIVELTPGNQRLWVRLPPHTQWEQGSALTAWYEVGDQVLYPGLRVEPRPPQFFTCSCMGRGALVFFVLTLCTCLCVLPYVVLPPLGLALLSLAPVLVFGSFVQFYFQVSVKVLQMVISFFEAIAWFFPLAVCILIIYFPLGWQDWVSNCQDTSAAEEVNVDCLGKRAIQAYLMTAFLEELLKYVCVRRILWFPFVADPWALCCYGGCAGLGFAALENALYVGTGSLFTALLRAGTAVPNHLMYGLLHGAFLAEQRFSSRPCRASFMLTPLLPMLLHGSHNFSIAVCQYVDLWVGLGAMLSVAVCAVCTLRAALMRIQLPMLNVHELIKSGICGWASKTTPPYLIPVHSQAGGVVEPLVGEATQIRGVGTGTFEAAAVEPSLLASLQCTCTSGKWYFETVFGPMAGSCRTGVVQSGSQMFSAQLGGDTESWGFGPEGLWHAGELVQPRTGPGPAVLGALLNLDDGWLKFVVDGAGAEQAAIDTQRGWLPAWSFTGTVGIRLDGRFAYDPPPGFLPIRRAAFRESPQVVANVVGILLSDSQSEL